MLTMPLTKTMKKKATKAYFKSSNIGRIGMKIPLQPVLESVEISEHLRGYHPTKGLYKKLTSFYEGHCRVRFDRKTFPKTGKSIVNNCFIDSKDGISSVYDYHTRALLGICKTDNVDKYTKKWKEQFNGIKKI